MPGWVMTMSGLPGVWDMEPPTAKAVVAKLMGVPAVEVMLSEPDSHEPFRQTDVVSFGCQGRFAGEGVSGYLHACAYLVQLLRLDGGAQTHLVQ